MNGSQDDRTPSDGQTTGNWTYTPSNAPEAAPLSTMPASESPVVRAPESPEVEWTASEFIAHHKGAAWYTLLALAAVAASAVVYLITRDIVSSVVIIIVAILFGVTAARKPRVLHYQLDHDGLVIGQKFYPYGGFRSFAVVDEGSFSNITFIPIKRFMPSLSIYYDPQDEQKIVTALAAHLPMQQMTHDTFERMMRRVRF